MQELINRLIEKAGISTEQAHKSIETIKTISAEELMQLAQKYLVEDAFYELTVI